jgi:hypothetical protein
VPDVIQCESKHVAIESDILFEVELYLTDVFYFYFARTLNIVLLYISG